MLSTQLYLSLNNSCSMIDSHNRQSIDPIVMSDNPKRDRTIDDKLNHKILFGLLIQFSIPSPHSLASYECCVIGRVR